MKVAKKVFLVTLIMAMSLSLFAKTEDNNWLQKELGFNIGFGVFANTSNLLGLIESARMAYALDQGQTYEFPGLDAEQQAAFNDMSLLMGRAMIVANIFSSLEYGFKTRITANMFIADFDVVVLPFDGNYNGRVDLMMTALAGIRAPFFIMPYFMMGVNFMFSFYPEEYTKLETWKGDWAAYSNFVFRPGMVTRAGVDFKMGQFAIGAYYQWTVKDFEEFVGFFETLKTAYENDPSSAGMALLGYQSRIGVSLTWYLIK